jgi:creatinine amidohydrolase
VVIVNGHGGNVEYLEQARDRLTSEGRSMLVWSPPLVDPHDSHAGYVETSIMLALDPQAVRVEEIRSAPAPHLADILPDLRVTGVKGVSPSGVLGDPRRADAELGRRLLSTWEKDLVESVARWRSEQSRARDPES